MYMLIDRLGDEFNHQTVTTEMKALCPRVQWVFRSACEYITKKDGAKVIKFYFVGGLFDISNLSSMFTCLFP